MSVYGEYLKEHLKSYLATLKKYRAPRNAPFYLPVMVVSFSGGLTSAYMSKWLIDNMSHVYTFFLVFANTGLEHEKTLEFIDRCDREWGLNIEWIESVTHPKRGKGQTYNIVNFKSASRNGEPFESLVKVEGISNAGTPRCSHRLKGIPLDKYRKSISKNAFAAIGIRVDEFDRMNSNYKKLNLMYPLITMKPTTEAEIVHWWDQQSFKLDLEKHYGNCVSCWKKSDRKLLTIAKNTPEYFDFFKMCEKKYGKVGIKDGNSRVWFRRHRNVNDIIDESEIPFVEYIDVKPEYQLDLLGFDGFNGCSESCEPFA